MIRNIEVLGEKMNVNCQVLVAVLFFGERSELPADEKHGYLELR
jgi:hypothetical protein